MKNLIFVDTFVDTLVMEAVSMATIDVRKNKNGEITGYRIRACVGRDEEYKQVWRTKTIPRPDGLTPARERREVQRQADEWEEAQKAEYKRSHSAEDKERITLADFIRGHWWKDHVQDGTHTPSSVSFFRYMSDDIVSYFGEKTRLNQIDAETVKRYVAHLNNKAVTKTGKPYSKATVQHHFSTLRNILQYARRMKYIASDPCGDLTAKEKPHREKKTVDYLEADEARRFIACLEQEPLYWRTLFNILVTAGLRRGEVCGLQWRDIDGDKLTITVSRNVTVDTNSETAQHIGKPKNGKSRTVPVSKRVYQMLQELRAEQIDKFGLTTSMAFVFCSETDAYKPMYSTNVTRVLRHIVKRYDLPDVSPHDLRHSAATLALESGASLKEIQELLGHADASTTLSFYAGISEEQKRRTVDGIENILAVGR